MRLFGPRTARRPSGLSVIGDRLTIRGEIDTDGTIRVDGRVEGTVHHAGMLIVGAGGGVVGDIEAGEVIIAGTVRGNVHATGRMEVEAGAAVHGEIRANNMLLHEGATLHGHVSIGAAPVSTATPSAPVRLELAQTPAQPSKARG